MEVFFYLPAIFMGWALGSNDAANVFGTAVANSLVKYRTAVIVSSIFVVLGAVLQGYRGIGTISSISSQSLVSAAISMLGAAISVTIFSRLGIPVSTSQAVVGSIVGIGLIDGYVNWSILVKVVICWISTPIGSMIIGYVSYKLFSVLFRKIPTIQAQDLTIKVAALAFGAYGSYALGANNVANVSGVFGAFMNPRLAALIGGASIALGIITYSYRVMMTVGKGIAELDHFSAVVAVFAESVTVWIFALIGVPVSTSQAVVGGVLGAGLARSTPVVNKKAIWRIVFGWFGTPAIAAGVSTPLYLLTRALIVK